MKAFLIAFAVLLPMAAHANPGIQHDTRLEQAAAEIVASKMGGLRGGFRHDEQPAFVSGQSQTGQLDQPVASEPETTGSVWKDGLAPARGIPAYRRGKI